MRKTTIYALALFLSINFSATAADILLSGVEYTLDTLEHFPVGPGSTYTAVQMKRAADGTGPLEAYVLQVDRRNPYIAFSQVLGKDAVIGTERPSAMAERKTTDTQVFFAGTNGDFFITQGNVGTPVGLTIGDSQFAYIGSTARRFGAIDDDNRPVIATDWSYQGTLLVGDKRLPIAHVNYERRDNELVLYNQHNGPTTLTNDFGTELLVELLEEQRWQTSGTMRMRILSKEQNTGNTEIPAGKAVLSGHGTMAQELDLLSVGDEVAVEFALTVDNELHNIAQSVGGDNYALILNNGVPEQSNFWNENHPRTGFGASLTGDTVVFCVVDGRTASSRGCNTKVLGEIMRYYGAWKAVNWDGGGSSCMYIRQFGQVNHASDGIERAVANAMFAVANVPEVDNTIAELYAYTPCLQLPMYGVHKPKFLGYNQYGILLDTDVQNVILSCDEATGYIDAQGRFVCLGDGVLTATYQDATFGIQVRVDNVAKPAIRLDSVLVSDDTDYAIEVNATVGKNTILLQPAALTWHVQDNAVCTISEDGVLNGLCNGTTWVYGTLSGTTDSLLVHVEIPETKPLLWEAGNQTDQWAITESGDWQTTLQPNDNGGMTLHMNYGNGGRLPFTSLELPDEQAKLYSLPEKLEVRLSLQNAPLNELHVGLRSNNVLQSTNCRFTDIVAQNDTSLFIDLTQELAMQSDIAAYPVRLTDLTFYWNPKAKGECTLEIEGIWLHYAAVSLGVESITSPLFTVFPNPAGDVLYVKGCAAGTMAVIYDLQGREALRQPLTEESAIDISRLGKGNWLLNVQGNTLKVMKK